jgi:hypothetical protein
VVTITTAAGCEYNAFLTDTKPERIVVDLVEVVNNLEEKQFRQLPLRSVRSIRTSQFKSEPDMQARVVLDIERPIEFRSFGSDNMIVVKLPAIADEAQFAAWQYPRQENLADQPAVEPEEVEAVRAEPVEESAPEDVPAVEQVSEDNETEEIMPTKLAVADPSAPAGVHVDTTPKRQVVDYVSMGLKDPFAPLVGAGSGRIVEGLPSLENLRLVGILEDPEISRALLEDAEGNGYMLKPNDKIKGGYLVAVTDNKAIFQVTEYGWTRTVALELAIPEIK